MKLTVEGNVNPYYVQTLCMLFFPGAKFSKAHESEEAVEAVVKAVENETSARADVVLKYA